MDDDLLPDVDGSIPRPPRGRPSVRWLREWVSWFGPGRLIVTALSIATVTGAGWWLVRSPTTPTESLLPMASAPQPMTAAVASSPPTTSGELAVHVAGAVRQPGVYELPIGSRVIDAIEAAGGMRRRADAGAVNLAAPLVDGTRVYVPVPGQEPPTVVSAATPPSAVVPGSGVPTAPIDLNESDAAALEELPGVGPATAAAIVEYRDANGPFASIDDLEEVPGIGPTKLEAVRHLVSL